MLRAHDSDDIHHNLMLVRPDNARVMQQREIRNRAHGHESIEALDFAARVPKGFAPVYLDVQHARLERKQELASTVGRQKKRCCGKSLAGDSDSAQNKPLTRTVSPVRFCRFPLASAFLPLTSSVYPLPILSQSHQVRLVSLFFLLFILFAWSCPQVSAPI